MEHKVKRGIARGIKFLRLYRKNYLDQPKEKYDGGITMMLLFLQNNYGPDFVFDEKCVKLTTCTRELYEKYPSSWFDDDEDDVFDLPSLKEIYFLKAENQKIDKYLDRFEKLSAQNYVDQMAKMIPILDMFNNSTTKVLQTALGVYGIGERWSDKAKTHKRYQEFKKRIISRLVKIIERDKEYNIKFLDPFKIMALYLLYLLEAHKQIKNIGINNLVTYLLKQQSTNGEWMTSDEMKGNEKNNVLITIFALGTLFEYYHQIELGNYSEPAEKTSQSNNNKGEIIQMIGQDKGLGKIIPSLTEGFGNRRPKPNPKGICFWESAEAMVYVLAVIFAAYLLFSYYRTIRK